MAIEVIIGAVANFAALLIAALALWDTRKFRKSDKEDESKNNQFSLKERIVTIEEKLSAHSKEIQETKESIKVTKEDFESEVKEIKAGFYNEVREIKSDIKNIFNILINMNKK